VQILLTSAAFLIAAVCAGLMGYAIQRGATCTVAAVDEVVSKRSSIV
jgi:toxin CptA